MTTTLEGVSCQQHAPAALYHSTTLGGKEIQLPDDGLRIETCRSSFSALICKFYISALVGIMTASVV